jgi:phage terminase large subunit
MTEADTSVYIPKPSFQDPVRFVKEVLGEQPYDKQIEILRTIGRSRRVSVVGCNGSGKDWAAARAVLWWVHAHRPAKAIVTGPTARQVDYIVWNELRYAHARASDTLGGQMFRTSRYEIDDQTFALGFATNSPHNILGFHSPSLLVVITEAHAMQQPEIDAIRRLNPTRLLMTGNPFVAAREFFDSHHSKRALYETVQISAFDTPNVAANSVIVPGMVTLEDIEDRKQDWGEDSPEYIGGVLGQFPDNLEGVVVPLRRAVEAAQRTLKPQGPTVLACDVARFGQDKTVVMQRKGPVARIIRRVKGHDTTDTVGFLKSYCEQHRPDVLVVDDTGVGGGVVDMLREARLPKTKLVPFIPGQRAENSDYFANRIRRRCAARPTRPTRWL